MEVAFIGLGRMGGNMVRRLSQGGHKVVAYNRTAEKTKELVGEGHGVVGAYTLEEIVQNLKESPRIVWIMVPAGQPVDDQIAALEPLLSKGDIIIDGGNSYYKDSVRRGHEVTARGFHFMDVGTSGGVWGLKVGYCMMIGGEKEIFQHCEPLFKTLAPPDGYGYMGDHGAGHLVKMVHNGVEYGMLQAYGEGFEILNASQYNLDLYKISHLWNQGSVVRSWLLELAELAFEDDPKLGKIKGWVADSGEGRWTVLEAMEHDVPAPIITLSLLERFRSRQDESFSAKVIAALRNQFGGHAIKSE